MPSGVEKGSGWSRVNRFRSSAARFGLFDRERCRIFCAAEFFDGTDFASRSTRETNERAKIGKRGVVKARGALGNKCRSEFPKFFPAGALIDRAPKIEQACQHARSIGFNNGNRLIESEAGDGVRRIFPDARKLLHLLD